MLAAADRRGHGDWVSPVRIRSHGCRLGLTVPESGERRCVVDERTAATATWCPGCRRPAGEAERCPSCGLRQSGADAARLRVVVHRLYEIAEQQRALAGETAALQLEQGRLLRLLGQGAAPVASRAPRELRPEVIRGVLLGLGSILVALAALIFAVVAWIRLGDLGRAGLLLAATMVAAAGSVATRRRLPATGEALAGLALALLLVDWYAVRRAGLADGWSATSWWALGTGAGAASAAGAARWLRVQRVAAVALAQVSAALTVLVVAEAPWTVGVGLGLVAAGSAACGARLAGHGGWRGAAVAAGLGAAFLELFALDTVLRSLPVVDVSGAAGPAAVLAAMALAPAAARAVLTAPVPRAALDGLVAAAAGALLASVGTLLAAVWESWSLLAAVAVLGAAAVGVGRVVPSALRRGTALAASATIAVGVLGLLGPLLLALSAPLAWLADPWTARLSSSAVDAIGRLPGIGGGLDGAYPVVVALLACAGAAGLAAVPVGGSRLVATRPAGIVAAAAGVGMVAVLPLAASWPLWAALLVPAAGALAAGTGAVLVDRGAGGLVAGVLAGCAAVLLALAASWALATEAGTLAFLGVVAAVAAAATGVSRSVWLRRGSCAAAAVAVAGESAATVVSAGGGGAQAGLAVVVAAGAVLVAGARWRQDASEGPVAEALGLAGIAVGIVLAAGDGRWLAAALTAAVPALLAAARPARRAYLWCGVLAAVAATWAWLAAAGVTLPEAYTLPAAAVALAAGATTRGGGRHPGSWLAFGPGLALALLPSLGLAVDQGGTARPLLLTGGALLVVVAGARAGLQAPLILGAATLLGLGADAVLPVAAQLPRWVTIGTAGLLLLWLGATAERQLARLRQLQRRFQELEQAGTAMNGDPGNHADPA